MEEKDERELILKNFRRVIDLRDIEEMNKRLYHHLITYCSFIAHYNINGFKKEYSGQGFRRFVEHFDLHSEINRPEYPNRYWITVIPKFADLHRSMVAYVTSVAPAIYKELEEEQKRAELALLKALARKHGVAMEVPSPPRQVSFFEEVS